MIFHCHVHSGDCQACARAMRLRRPLLLRPGALRRHAA
jgi:hypothetical protein